MAAASPLSCSALLKTSASSCSIRPPPHVCPPHWNKENTSLSSRPAKATCCSRCRVGTGRFREKGQGGIENWEKSHRDDLPLKEEVVAFLRTWKRNHGQIQVRHTQAGAAPFLSHFIACYSTENRTWKCVLRKRGWHCSDRKEKITGKWRILKKRILTKEKGDSFRCSLICLYIRKVNTVQARLDRLHASSQTLPPASQSRALQRIGTKTGLFLRDRKAEHSNHFQIARVKRTNGIISVGTHG